MVPSVVLSMTLLAAGCGTAVEAGGDSGAHKAVPVRTVVAEKTTVRRSISAGGVAAAWRSARLVPTMPGNVARIPVTLGQDVKEGDLLAQMDDATLRLQAKQASKALELAELQFQNAEREAERARRLADGGALSPQQLDQAELGFKLATAQYEQATAAVETVQSQLGDGRLVAPFAGTISGVAVEEGEYFSAMSAVMGPPSLITVTAMDPIRLDIHVPDTDLARIRVGMSAVIESDAIRDRSHRGTVELVNSVADPGSRTFLVRIRVENEDHSIKPGMFLRAQLVLEEHADVVAIPHLAVLENKGVLQAVVVTDSTAERREVQVGVRGDEAWEVAGVEAGEQVIVEGHYGLPDGSPVRVVP
jgi:RND family efflux transporter MFP subunit